MNLEQAYCTKQIYSVIEYALQICVLSDKNGLPGKIAID